MQPDRRCSQCGQVIPWGEAECPLCSEHRGYLWSLRRDTFLVLISVILILLFVVAGFAVRSYHGREDHLAWDWNKRGDEALKVGREDAAIVDFRNALLHSRDHPVYQLHLAQALAATGHIRQARTYLLNLRDREPGNGTVNLELARLAAGDHDISEAVRYYHDALYSEWESDPAGRRRAIRLELIQFLLNSDQKETARAELIVASTNLPPDPGLQTKVGGLLVDAGGCDDALRLFRQALAAAPRSARALAGAGECYFQRGQYAEALRFLERAVQQDRSLTRAAAMLGTARAVLSLDPFLGRLAEQARAQRASLDFAQARARLESCAAQRGIDLKGAGDNRLPALYAEAAALQPRARESHLQRDPEVLSKVMDLVFEIEKTTSQICGEPQGHDLALLLIARQQEGARP